MSCEYCEGRKKMQTEYGELKISKITPLPAINLTDGTVDLDVDPPFYALFYNAQEELGAEEEVCIQYCPWCGCKLNAVLEEWEADIIDKMLHNDL